MSQGRLGAQRAEDLAALRSALAAASDRGLRRLLVLGRPTSRVGVAVVPLPKAYDETQCATMVLLGKRTVCETLSVQSYAQTHGLTRAETAVLGLLYCGMPAGRIAAHLGVAVSTVRTQIGSIRAKAGVRSVSALIQHMATLPPLVGILHSRNVDPGLEFAFD
jgi:DNA-binding CsgD family transcriptional regulator